MSTKRVEVDKDSNFSEVVITVNTVTWATDRAYLQTLDSCKGRSCLIVSPANLRAIAAACVEAADELENTNG